jgi:beta-galactosidase
MKTILHHPGKYPAITTNNFGKGTLTYIGTAISEAIMTKLVETEAASLGISEKENPSKYPLIVRSGKNNDGKIIHYYFNYSSETRTAEYIYAKGIDLLTKSPVQKGSKIQVNPWDLAIIEE